MRSKLSIMLATSVVVLALQAAVPAQEASDTPSPKASINDLSWIAGHWQGKAMGGDFEETWNPPKGGAMMGMFKFIKDGEVNFYEILTIVPKNDSLVLRLKHFHNDLVGWEEKDKSVEFPLNSISKKEAKFDGLTFTKISDDEMLIVVVTKQKSGKTQELRFECHRAGKAKPNDGSQAIAQVFALDSVLSKQRDRLPEKHSLATAVQAYVVGLDNTDFSECPSEFAREFKKHRDAWNDSISFFEKHNGLHGEMHAVIDKIRQMDQAVVSELDRCMLPIMESWKAVENEAKKHGVD
jgi:hypothetical protein